LGQRPVAQCPGIGATARCLGFAVGSGLPLVGALLVDQACLVALRSIRLALGLRLPLPHPCGRARQGHGALGAQAHCSAGLGQINALHLRLQQGALAAEPCQPCAQVSCLFARFRPGAG